MVFAIAKNKHGGIRKDFGAKAQTFSLFPSLLVTFFAKKIFLPAIFSGTVICYLENFLVRFPALGDDRKDRAGSKHQKTKTVGERSRNLPVT